MTGKLADTVMSVRNGEQIARKYQPVVYNPSTAAQVAVRARMKLMSQVSAVLGSTIAMPRIGSVSARNRFVKANFDLSTYSNNEAQVQVENLKLTSSVVFLPAVRIDRANENSTVSLAIPATNLSRVVYVVLGRESDNTLRMIAEKVVTPSGEEPVFGTTIPLGTTGEVYVLAYGIRDNTDAARAKFGDMQVLTASDVAKLIVTRTLTESDITLTETRGLYSPSATAQSIPDVMPSPEDENRSSKKK